MASSFKYAEADESPGLLLWRLSSLWKARLDSVFEEFEITQTQYAILASLLWFEENNRDVSQQTLVDHLKIDKMTLSKAVRGLEQKDYLQRLRSTVDSRSFQLEFTKPGKLLTKKAISRIEKTDELFFSVLEPSELKRFKALAKALTDLNDEGLRSLE